MDLAEIVREFADSVVAQNVAIAKGDATSGNRFAKRYITAFDRLRSRGDEGREALATLLTDTRADVRVMAAAFLLRHKHPQARAVLEIEAKGVGRVAFEAAQALLRWDEGSWSLDPK